MESSGIYQIRNIENGKVYVGSAVCFQKRFWSHASKLRRGVHHSVKLQRAWNKHGEYAFKFEILEKVSNKNDLIQKEQIWICKLNAANRDNYNVLPEAGSRLGSTHSEESKKKISKNRKGIAPVFKDPESRLRKMAEAAKHRPPISEETRRKISIASTGRKLSDSAKEKLSKASLGREVSAETRIKLSIANKGKKLSPEHIAKMSASKKGVKQSPELIAKRAAANMGRVFSAETRAKIAAKATGRKMSQEAIEKTASAHRGVKQSPELIEKRAAKIRGRKMAPGVGFKRWETRRANLGQLREAL